MGTNAPRPIGDKDRFSVVKTLREDGIFCFYTITRLGDALLVFTAKVLTSQAAAAKPSDVEAIERWCQSHPERLVLDGETILIDLAALKTE
jgi:hypothetical protein